MRRETVHLPGHFRVRFELYEYGTSSTRYGLVFSFEAITLGILTFVRGVHCDDGKAIIFWREFWLLWSAGAITGAIFAALVRIPITPVAAVLLLRGHSQKSLLVGTEAIEITVEFERLP